MLKFFSLVAATATMCCIFAAGANADRLILIPEGDTLSTGSVKAEYNSRMDNNDGQIYWLNVGFSRLEVEAARFQKYRPNNIDTLSAQVALLPETSFCPAVAFGIRDIANRTGGKGTPYDGRSFYLAASKGIPLTGGVPLILQDLRLHGGIGTNALSGIFIGADGTLPLGFHVAGEYDANTLNFSVSHSIIPSLTVELTSIKSDLYYGGRFSMKL